MIIVVILEWILILGIAVTSVLSVYYSFKSRRASQNRTKGLYSARMNISMGIMLLLIAIIQLFMYTASSVQVIVGCLFALLGLFNLFAGIRNHGLYGSMNG
jgi:hypothetical protein